jgi:hypothetical protein
MGNVDPITGTYTRFEKPAKMDSEVENLDVEVHEVGALSQNGLFATFVDENGSVSIFNTMTGESILSNCVLGANWHARRSSPNGSSIAYTNEYSSLIVADIITGEVECNLGEIQRTRYDFSPDGKQIIMVKESRFSMHDLETNERTEYDITEFSGSTLNARVVIREFCLWRDNSHCIFVTWSVGSRVDSIVCVNIEARSIVWIIDNPSVTKYCWKIEITPDNELIVLSFSMDGIHDDTYVVNSARGELVWSLLTGNTGSCISLDSSILFTSSWDKISMYSLSDGHHMGDIDLEETVLDVKPIESGVILM